MNGRSRKEGRQWKWKTCRREEKESKEEKLERKEMGIIDSGKLLDARKDGCFGRAM